MSPSVYSRVELIPSSLLPFLPPSEVRREARRREARSSESEHALPLLLMTFRLGFFGATSPRSPTTSAPSPSVS